MLKTTDCARGIYGSVAMCSTTETVSTLTLANSSQIVDVTRAVTYSSHLPERNSSADKVKSVGGRKS